MATLTEQITKLTTKIERYDEDIARATAAREQAIAQVQHLLGATTAKAPAIAAATKRYAGKLGDRITTMLQNTGGGLTRDYLADKIKVSPSKVGLSLYHLKQKGQVFENNGLFFLPPTTTTEPVIPE